MASLGKGLAGFGPRCFQRRREGAGFASDGHATPGEALFPNGSTDTFPFAPALSSKFPSVCARLIPPATAAPRSSAACRQTAAASDAPRCRLIHFAGFATTELLLPIPICDHPQMYRRLSVRIALFGRLSGADRSQAQASFGLDHGTRSLLRAHLLVKPSARSGPAFTRAEGPRDIAAGRR